MVQKSNLPDLPGNEDNDFWGDAERYRVVPEATLSDGPHNFAHISRHQAYCGHCGWGFELDMGDKVVDGHVYTRKGRKVI